MKTVNPKNNILDFMLIGFRIKTMRKAFDCCHKFRFKPKLTMEIEAMMEVIKNFKKREIISVEPCLNLARITKKQVSQPKF